jgi:Ser/Thr protein kinase RdoA (MazF antagonist)
MPVEVTSRCKHIVTFCLSIRHEHEHAGMSVSRHYITQKILAAFGIDPLPIAARNENVSSSTLSTQGIDRFVVPHYEVLNGATHSKLVHRGVNDTYSIASAGGLYSLKVYQVNWRSRESIADELRCMEQLDAGGIPTAPAIPRRDGDTITTIPTPEGLRHAVLARWIPGVAPSCKDATHSARVGRSLARLHTVSDRMQVGRTRSSQLDMTSLFERPVTVIRSHVAHDPAQASRIDALVQRLRHRVRRAEPELTDWGFCHGDAANVNLRVDGEHVHFFDFEWCNPGWRAYDLATYIWSAYHVSHVRNFRWQPLLDSYLAERPQSVASVGFIPLFVVLRHLWYASQRIGLASHLGANTVSNDFCADVLTFCEEFDLGSSRAAPVSGSG